MAVETSRRGLSTLMGAVLAATVTGLSAPIALNRVFDEPMVEEPFFAVSITDFGVADAHFQVTITDFGVQ